ncbi:carbonic anhydrase 1-like [Mytilus trossulus]|uniref:carbonic anhydrase 1-like n=1 Tax=Mytilus trossulus TaxID=6551 RepID=UPI00300580DB
MDSSAAFLLFCIQLMLFRAIEGSAKWGYYQRGVPPSFWHCLDGKAMCNHGRSQSPVDIKTNDVVTDNRIVPFDFSDLENTERVKMEMRNNGHAVIIDFPDHQPLVKRGGLQETLQLNELHFHWGSNSQWGSEHTINGHQYAMEVHFDFVTTGNGPVELRAVISVLIYAGKHNSNYDEIVSMLPYIASPGSKIVLDKFPVIDLFPESTTCWYRYCGSFTTPPCTENIIWTIFEQSISMSEYQINAFRALMGTPRMFEYNIVDTFRPVQPLWQRKVTRSCPRRKNSENYRRFESNDRCINHGYNRGKSQKKYSQSTSRSDNSVCLWVDFYYPNHVDEH